MNKIWVLYRNEMYKLFRARKMLILLIFLLIAPFLASIFTSAPYDGGENANRIFSHQEMYELHVSNLDQTVAYVEDALQWEENVDVLGFLLHSYKASQDDLDTLWAEDPEFAARSYIPEILNAVNLSQVLLDPVADGYEEGVEFGDPFTAEGFPGVFYMGTDLVPQTRKQAEELVSYGEAVLNEKSVEAYAAFELKVLDHSSEDRLLPSYREPETTKQERNYYEGLQATNRMTELELYNPGYMSRRVYTLMSIGALEDALETGLETDVNGGGPLLPSRRQEIVDELALNNHIFEQGKLIGDPEYSPWTLRSNQGRSLFFTSYLILMFVLMIYIGVQAGSMISSEMESGSIKLLIISPVKRWKMYAAKLLALVSLIFILVGFAFLWTLLWAYLLNGRNSIPGYTGVYKGQVYVLSFLQQAGLDILSLTVKLIFYSTLALMISSLFRKTAIAVGLSIGVVFADFVATLIYYNTEWSFWYRYMPFTNLDLGNIRQTTLVAQFMSFITDGVVNYNRSLLFSVLYIIVFIVLFIWAGMDAFTKRDI